jgi:acetolactate decarboxylase
MSNDKTTVKCGIGGCSCTSTPAGKPFEVQWQGAQRDVLGGDIRGKVNLEQLAGLTDLYGLGPLEEVKGEITILDSVATVARVTDDGDIAIAEGFSHQACFLVYSQVPRWQKVVLPEVVVDEKTLEAALPDLAEEYGIDPTIPFPFLLRGQPDRLVFHILNKTDGLKHSPELHEKAKIRFTLEDAGVEVIGFHSTAHRGIFTPGHSSIHIHVRSSDGTASGHVDTLSFPGGLDLFLPVI